MKIITVPHPALRNKSLPVTTIDKKLIEFIKDMEKTLMGKKDPQGVGLSAPQLNKNLRLFSTFFEHGGNKPEIRTYINPEIIRASDKMTLGPDSKKPILEGCLSIPNVWGAVQRHHWIKLNYYTLNPNLTLEKHSQRFESFPARVIQHEFDHLEGILFTDRTLKDNLPLYQEKNGQLEEIQLNPQY